ncbi:hypothetical protein [Streptomyces turgidiscabies]|uniref:hypothetical protein n=1 Tax=Streptomyces turgidiscabies TaxID=85558 RepID=UPI0038F767B9
MATPRQEKAAQAFVEDGGKSASAAMRKAGFSDAYAKNPKKLTSTPTWEELLNKYLPDKKLAEVHKKILNAQKLEHMVFPLGMEEADIKKLLNSVGCKPKKIKHGEQAIHVWYWAPDSKAQAKGVELGYKVKGKLTQKVEHSGQVNTAVVEFIGGTTETSED